MSEINDLDAEVIAVCVDSIELNQRVVSANQLGFDILSDPQSTVIRKYGLFHEEGAGHDIARPAIFILDRDQRITWKFIPDNFRSRIDPNTIVAELSRID